jgi:hypothetical protein
MPMLSKRHCPLTGVVNFFFREEPHFAVGSVVRNSSTNGYEWRCYTEPCSRGGMAPDMKSAEQKVAQLCHEAAARRQFAGMAA